MPREALAALGVDDAGLREIHVVADAYNLANPENLLSVLCLARMLGGAPRFEAPVERTWTPPAAPGPLVPMVDVAALPKAVAELLDLVTPQGAEGSPRVVPSLYRHFGHRPQFVALLVTLLQAALRRWLHRAQRGVDPRGDGPRRRCAGGRDVGAARARSRDRRCARALRRLHHSDHDRRRSIAEESAPQVVCRSMDLVELLTRWELPLVFASVLLEQGGLPLPAAPLLVAAGALSETGVMRSEQILAAALVACLVADHFWFWIGRGHGRRVLGTICRLSLSPDTCVRQTDDLIGRHGAALLLVAKFIPGVSAMAIPSAAAMGLSYRRFILYDGLGCLLWAGTYIGAGMIFSREVNRFLDYMSTIGGWALLILVALVALYVGLKLAAPRAPEAPAPAGAHLAVRNRGAVAADPDLLIVDARTMMARDDDPRTLPRSVVLGDRTIVEVLPLDARGRTIVTFCTCPNEASAALLAEELIKAGYERVRVLTGGADAIEVLSAER